MIHPQPTTVLLLLANPAANATRTSVSTRIPTFLTGPRRRHGKQAVPAVKPAAEASAAAPGKVHAGERHRHS
jgi:hypothetical protein